MHSFETEIDAQACNASYATYETNLTYQMSVPKRLDKLNFAKISGPALKKHLV